MVVQTNRKESIYGVDYVKKFIARIQLIIIIIGFWKVLKIKDTEI